MLSGGHETSLPGMAIDRALLESLGTARPRVAVIPAASTWRKRPAAALVARRYWSQLGVVADVIAPDLLRARRDPLPTLRAADLIVLTGAHPARLVATTATTLWPHILDCWRQGTALAGSSAGAMALCQWRLHLAPPRPLRFVRGLGLIPACAAAPHFNRPVVHRWTIAASHARPDLLILGIDEHTAMIGRDGDYAVHGTGSVSIIRAGVVTPYASGTRIPLDDLVSQAPAVSFPHPWAPV
jgi:cyanophycinase-like exopeptidase